MQTQVGQTPGINLSKRHGVCQAGAPRARPTASVCGGVAGAWSGRAARGGGGGAGGAGGGGGGGGASGAGTGSEGWDQLATGPRTGRLHGGLVACHRGLLKAELFPSESGGLRRNKSNVLRGLQCGRSDLVHCAPFVKIAMPFILLSRFITYNDLTFGIHKAFCSFKKHYQQRL